MNMVTVNTLAEVIPALKKTDVNLVLCPGILPADTDQHVLFTKGSFVSPLVVDSPVIAGLELTRHLTAFLGTRVFWLAEDIRALCGLFRGLPEIDGIAVQITASNPTNDSNTANVFHVDTRPRCPEHEFIRLTRVYSGPGTEWVQNDNVDRDALRTSIRYAEDHFVRALPRLEPRHAELSTHIVKDPQLVHTIPPGWISMFKGGVERGLVHRAPQSERHRVVIIITALDK